MAFLIPKKSISFTIASVYALIIILSALLGYEEKNDKTYLNLLVFPMNVEFFMGVIASILFKRISRATAVAFIWAGTVIFFLSGVLSNLNINPISNQFNRVVLFGIPSFFIITGLVKYELTSKIRVHNIFLLLGESSYTLYLIHLPVLVASFKIISVLKIKNDLVLYSLIFITIVGICYASMLFYKFVEMPIITKLNSLRRIKVANEI